MQVIFAQFLIIDHTRSGSNVYFLNSVTEWDLLTLAAEAELAIPPGLVETPASVAVEREPPPTTEPSTPEPTTPPEEDDDEGGGVGLYIFLAVAGAAAFGVIYYLKVFKPKQEREMYGDGDEVEPEKSAESDDFEDVDESEETEQQEIQNADDSEHTKEEGDTNV